MAKETLHLTGTMFSSHQSPHLFASFEFEHPTVQEKKLRFRSLSLTAVGISENGPVYGRNNDHKLEPDPLVLSLSARASMDRESVRPIGWMSLQPACLVNDGQAYWDWELSKEDIERIQQRNYHDHDIQIHLDLEGILGIRSQESGISLFAIRGSNYFNISRTVWNDLLHATEYSGKFPEKLGFGSIVNDVAWESAAKQLEGARMQLHVGNTYAALEACLSVIERSLPEPYNHLRWKQFLEELQIQPDSKCDAIARLFGGIGTYLNRVGHHHSREQRNDETKEFIRPPLDEYEAELLIGMTQLMVTYLERLRT